MYKMSHYILYNLIKAKPLLISRLIARISGLKEFLDILGTKGIPRYTI